MPLKFDLDHPSIGVTGVTGHLGGLVARKLASAGIPQTLVVRDAARAPDLPGATVTVTSYGDAFAARKALQGVDRVLMVSATESPERLAQHQSFIDAASDAGVTHLTYISFYGAAPDATFTFARDHWSTEQYLRTSGLNYTILRNNIYSDILTYLAGEDGVIRGPAGQGRLAPVTQNDIADAAVTVLTQPSAHNRYTYDLTGPQALTLDEIASTLCSVTGRTVSYHQETVEEAYASRASHGTPAWQLDAWVSTYTAIANGEMNGISDHIPQLTGRPATTLKQHLETLS